MAISKRRKNVQKRQKNAKIDQQSAKIGKKSFEILWNPMLFYRLHLKHRLIRNWKSKTWHKKRHFWGRGSRFWGNNRIFINFRSRSTSWDGFRGRKRPPICVENSNIIFEKSRKNEKSIFGTFLRQNFESAWPKCRDFSLDSSGNLKKISLQQNPTKNLEISERKTEFLFLIILA